jgi:antitoxin HicB
MRLGSTEMDDVTKYSTRISYSAEDQGYIAVVPELPGCSAFGEMAEEALCEIRPAIEAWISAAHAAGNPIPPPAALEDDLPSGKFLVRVAKTVHAQLVTAAQHEGVSLNQYVGTILATATLRDVYARVGNQANLVTTNAPHGQTWVAPVNAPHGRAWGATMKADATMWARLLATQLTTSSTEAPTVVEVTRGMTRFYGGTSEKPKSRKSAGPVRTSSHG